MDNYEINFETWDKLALAYQEKFMELDLYNDTYNIFCELITKPNAKVLEIGCGPGNITRYILSKRPDLDIKAIDVAPNMIRLAQENNSKATFRVMDAREIYKLTGKFEAIMCGFCMPYLSKEDCEKLIKDCGALLNSGGIFYFSTIEDDYRKSGLETSSSGDKMYVYYHQEDYLQKFIKNNNLETKYLIRKDYLKPDGTHSTHIIFIATKH